MIRVAVLLIVLAFPALADSLPDPVLTPGAIASTDQAEVCAFGYAKSHRQTPNALKDAVARAYGLTSRRDVEMDHRIPLCLGGADTAANLWPQPLPEARAKDVLERETCKAVCNGSMSLSDAQKRFMGDWRK